MTPELLRDVIEYSLKQGEFAFNTLTCQANLRVFSLVDCL